MLRTSNFACILGLALLLIAPCAAQAKEVPDRLEPAAGPTVPPPTLNDLKEIDEGSDEPPTGLQLRQEALHEAAVSFGARGGLARRTWEIMQELRLHAAALDRTFDFSRLLVPVSSGLLMEPPIVSEADDASVVAERGQEAAVANKIYRINQNARIVTTPRNWRAYLERDWGDVTPPPSILLPQDDDERDEWTGWVEIGWREGYKQADDIFQADLDRLVRDFTGMVRYRSLLAQGIISAPYAAHQDRGVTGGGNEMRVGDQAITITGASQLNPNAMRWTPADH
jgi:defect-in-organelle-trafficking protein DotC